MPRARTCSYPTCSTLATGRCAACCKPVCRRHAVMMRLSTASSSRRERVCLPCLETHLDDPGRFGAIAVSVEAGEWAPSDERELSPSLPGGFSNYTLDAAGPGPWDGGGPGYDVDT